VLRPFDEKDVPGIAEACADPDTGRFIPGIPVPYTEADALRYLELTREWARDGDRLPLAIADAETDELLGAIDLHLGEEASIGYWVAPSARGRGVATRALVLLAGWALAEGGVERLGLTTHAENVASQRVAEKSGFVRVGTVRHDPPLAGDRRETVVYERRRS
jgi:ribosomal-protein-alanine N-acetyltransferase